MTGLGEKNRLVCCFTKKNHCCICTNLTTICAENQTLFPGNKLFTTRRNDLRPVTRGTVKNSYKL